MQLEISNAQRSEFEERSLELAQEVRDVQEERKIGEKKSGALAKDLKRQLLQEKQRNDKLSDKLDKLLAEASANVVIGIEMFFLAWPRYTSFPPPSPSWDLLILGVVNLFECLLGFLNLLLFDIEYFLKILIFRKKSK